MENKKLTFNLDFDNRPFKEDILKTGGKGSLFEEQYHHAFIQLNQYLLALKEWDEHKDPDLDNLNNIFAFIGDRGSGKTSCMVSVGHALIKKDQGGYTSSELSILDEYKEIKKAKFHTIDLIDPTYFDSNNNLLSLFLAKLFASFRERESKEIVYFERRNQDKRNNFLEHLAQAQEKLRLMLGAGRDDDYENSLEHLTDLSAAVDLKNAIKTVEDDFMDYFDMKDTLLLLRIDDIDLSTEKAAEMAEIIRKYFVQPNMIVLMSVKMDQMKMAKKNELVRQYADLNRFEQRRGRNDEHNQMEEIEESFNEMVEQYLIKLIPQSQRIYMPDSEYYCDRPLEITSERFDKPMQFCSVKNAVLELIFSKTRYLFYNSALTTSFMVPRNLRELLQLFKLLCLMDDYWADRNAPSLYNKKAFKKYLFESWTHGNLNISMQSDIHALIAIDDVVFLNGRVLECLRERFSMYKDGDIADIMSVIDISSVYNISVGDVLGVIECLERKNLGLMEQKFLFLLKTIYSIRLYESYDAATELHPDNNSLALTLKSDKFKRLNEYEKLTAGFLVNTDLIDLLPRSVNRFYAQHDILSQNLAKLMKKCNDNWEQALTDNLVQTVEIVMLCIARSRVNRRIMGNYRSERGFPHLETIVSGRLVFDLGCLFFNVHRVDECYKRFNQLVLLDTEGKKKERVGAQFIKNLMDSQYFSDTLYGRFLSTTIKERGLRNRNVKKGDKELLANWLSFCTIRNAEILSDFITETREKDYPLDMNAASILSAYFDNASQYYIYSYDRPDEGEAPYKITFSYLKDMANVLKSNRAAKEFQRVFGEETEDDSSFV